MRTFDSASVSATAFLGGAALVLLTGCSQLTHVLEGTHEERFETYEQAVDGWVGVDIPGWIPEDATDLRNVATDDELVSVVRVVSDAPLGGECVLADREGLPALDASWSTESWPDELARCGDYEVMSMDDGWLGWLNP